jgi:hypothetical protein
MSSYVTHCIIMGLLCISIILSHIGIAYDIGWMRMLFSVFIGVLIQESIRHFPRED